MTVEQKRSIYFSLDFWIVPYSSKDSEIANSTCISLDWFSQPLKEISSRLVEMDRENRLRKSELGALRNFNFLADKKIDGVQSNYSQKH